MKLISKITFISFLAIILLVSTQSIALAEGNNGIGSTAPKTGLLSCNGLDCDFCDMIQTADNVFRFAIELSFLLIFGIIVWSGLTIMTSGGDEAKFNNGRKRLTIALTGLLIVLLAWTLIHQGLAIIAGQGLFQGNFADWTWNEIPCEIPTE